MLKESKQTITPLNLDIPSSQLMWSDFLFKVQAWLTSIKPLASISLGVVIPEKQQEQDGDKIELPFKNDMEESQVGRPQKTIKIEADFETAMDALLSVKPKKKL